MSYFVEKSYTEKDVRKCVREGCNKLLMKVRELGIPIDDFSVLEETILDEFEFNKPSEVLCNG